MAENRFLLARIRQSGLTPLLILALAKFIIHILTAGQYGYFIDEFYTIASAKHLTFGFVDIPPLVPIISAGWITLFGDSMISIRILAAIPGAAIVFMSGLIARELGGGRLAQVMTALLVLLGPVWLAFNSFLAYDGFDQVATTGFLLALILLLKRDEPKLWPLVGVLAALALLCKYTLLFYGAALLCALLLTPYRKHLITLHFWLAVLAGIMLLLPHIIWESVHGWPLFEYWAHYLQSRTYHAPATEFVLMQILLFNPLTILFWICGLVYLLAGKSMRPFRVLGYLYIFLMLIYFIISAKAYMSASIYPVLFASGLILIEKLCSKYQHKIFPKIAGYIYLGLTLSFGLILVPCGLPLFDIETEAQYFKILSFITGQVKFDNEKVVQLPQYLADRLGWEERVKSIADVYQSLPTEEKKHTAIFTAYYGFASAINLLGKKYDLPPALSGHLSYYLWGPGKNGKDIKTIITVQIPLKFLTGVAGQIVEAGRIRIPAHAMPFDQNSPIYICRKLYAPLPELWPRIKHYD